MTEPKLVNEIPVGNELGEGVIWDARRHAVWWTDIQKCRLYRYSPDNGRLEEWQTPERLACFAPVADEEYLVAAFASGFAYFDPVSGQLDWIERIEADTTATRLNDGRVDRSGRFWAGTMVEGDADSSVSGSLYCLGPELQSSAKIFGLSISNSLCWSPDSAYMYHADTPSGRIDRYAFDRESGEPGERSTFAETEDGCWPDGSAVDADGFLWNAQWGGSKVVRYSPDGDVDLELPVPVSQPSCVAFGGTDLRFLFVTTARQDLGAEELGRQNRAGNFFVYETEFHGLADAEFKPSRSIST